MPPKTCFFDALVAGMRCARAKAVAEVPLAGARPPRQSSDAAGRLTTTPARMKNARFICRLAIAVVSSLPCGLARAASPADPPSVSSWLSPTALAVSPDGQQLYVACATAARVLVLDLKSRQLRQTITVPASPLGLALTPDGRTLYVTCAAPESAVCVVDTTQARVVVQFATDRLQAPACRR